MGIIADPASNYFEDKLFYWKQGKRKLDQAMAVKASAQVRCMSHPFTILLAKASHMTKPDFSCRFWAV